MIIKDTNLVCESCQNDLKLDDFGFEVFSNGDHFVKNSFLGTKVEMLNSNAPITECTVYIDFKCASCGFITTYKFAKNNANKVHETIHCSSDRLK